MAASRPYKPARHKALLNLSGFSALGCDCGVRVARFGHLGQMGHMGHMGDTSGSISAAALAARVKASTAASAKATPAVAATPAVKSTPVAAAAAIAPKAVAAPVAVPAVSKAAAPVTVKLTAPAVTVVSSTGTVPPNVQAALTPVTSSQFPGVAASAVPKITKIVVADSFLTNVPAPSTSGTASKGGTFSGFSGRMFAGSGAPREKRNVTIKVRPFVLVKVTPQKTFRGFGAAGAGTSAVAVAQGAETIAANASLTHTTAGSELSDVSAGISVGSTVGFAAAGPLGSVIGTAIGAVIGAIAGLFHAKAVSPPPTAQEIANAKQFMAEYQSIAGTVFGRNLSQSQIQDCVMAVCLLNEFGTGCETQAGIPNWWAENLARLNLFFTALAANPKGAAITLRDIKSLPGHGNTNMNVSYTFTNPGVQSQSATLAPYFAQYFYTMCMIFDTSNGNRQTACQSIHLNAPGPQIFSDLIDWYRSSRPAWDVPASTWTEAEAVSTNLAVGQTAPLAQTSAPSATAQQLSIAAQNAALSAGLSSNQATQIAQTGLNTLQAGGTVTQATTAVANAIANPPANIANAGYSTGISSAVSTPALSSSPVASSSPLAPTAAQAAASAAQVAAQNAQTLWILLGGAALALYAIFQPGKHAHK